MDPQQLEQLRLLIASGAPVNLQERFPKATAQDVYRAIEDTDVLFRDFGLGSVTETRALDEPDARGVVGVIRFASTVEIPDREGSIVRVKGSKTERAIYHPWLGERIVTPGGFMTKSFHAAGGPFLWSHNIGEILPPIGGVIESKVARVDTPEHGRRWAVIQDVELYQLEDLPISRTVAQLYLVTRTLRTVSVGFAKIHVHFPRDEKEYARLGVRPPFGVEFVTSDQVELSSTPTPMNPLALTIDRAASTRAAAEVDRGLTELVQRDLLTASEREAVGERLLAPLTAADRAAAKVRGFVDFAHAIRTTGLWPSFDDASAEERAEAARVVAIRARTAEDADLEVETAEEPEAPAVDVVEQVQRQIAVGMGEALDRDLATFSDDPAVALAAVRQVVAVHVGGEVVDVARAIHDLARRARDADALEEALGGVPMDFAADDEGPPVVVQWAGRLREELDAVRGRLDETAEALAETRTNLARTHAELVQARATSASGAGGGPLTSEESTLVLSALEALASADTAVSGFLDLVTARGALTEDDLAAAAVRGILDSDDADAALAPVVERILGRLGGAAPAAHPSPGDLTDVGDAALAATREARQIAGMLPRGGAT